MVDDFDFHRALAEERRRDRAIAQALHDACKIGDVDRFYEAADLALNASIDGWRLGFKKIGLLGAVTPDIQAAFLRVWIETKSLRDGTRVDLIKALRVLLPPYSGPDVRLYRGEFFRNRLRRRCGVSWSADLSIAERFAQDGRQASEGGSVILETRAPAAAIIASTEVAGDYYGEREFLVDPVRLLGVKVIRHFPQISHEEWERVLHDRAQGPDDQSVLA